MLYIVVTLNVLANLVGVKMVPHSFIFIKFSIFSYTYWLLSFISGEMPLMSFAYVSTGLIVLYKLIFIYKLFVTYVWQVFSHFVGCLFTFLKAFQWAELLVLAIFFFMVGFVFFVSCLRNPSLSWGCRVLKFFLGFCSFAFYIYILILWKFYQLTVVTIMVFKTNHKTLSSI